MGWLQGLYDWTKFVLLCGATRKGYGCPGRASRVVRSNDNDSSRSVNSGAPYPPTVGYSEVTNRITAGSTDSTWTNQRLGVASYEHLTDTFPRNDIRVGSRDLEYWLPVEDHTAISLGFDSSKSIYAWNLSPEHMVDCFFNNFRCSATPKGMVTVRSQ